MGHLFYDKRLLAFVDFFGSSEDFWRRALLGHLQLREIELGDSSSVSGKAMASVVCLRSSSTGGSACRRG
jgi:hypothetical protein